MEFSRTDLSPFGKAKIRSVCSLSSIAIFGLALVLSSCSGLKKTTTSNEPKDSTKSKNDTSKVGAVSSIDSITNSIGNTVGKVGDFLSNLIPGNHGKDSTIIIAPQKVDNPAVNPALPPTSGGFISTPVKRQLQFDSLGNVTVHDVVQGTDVRQPETQSLDDYIKAQQDESLRNSYHDAAQKYANSIAAGPNAPGSAGAQKGNGILSDYSSISIPIPPSIVPTIFGRPSINLRVNGDVAIHLAYRDNQFLATTGALFAGSETGLDFKQEVNMNIAGSVGDKIKINTDFGSLRQFSFDNIFKLSYQGFPDEIIQSIEAGDVSFKTPSKYIGIQSALFGFKSVMRFGPLYLTTIVAQKKGDHQSKTFGGGPGSSSGTDYVIQPANYRKNMYFVDSIYIPGYESYYSQVPSNNVGNVISQNTIEVWRSTNLQNIQRVIARAWYGAPTGGVLPALPPNTYHYSQNYHGAGQEPYYEAGPVVRLDTNSYSFNYSTGVLTLNQEPADNDFIAVSYQLPDGSRFGERGVDIVDTELVLKLVKPKNLYGHASYPQWQNMLKNSYYVGATNIDETSFSTKIAYTLPTGGQYEYVRGVRGSPLVHAISVMGLDRYNNASPSIRQPDGLFDVFAAGQVSPILDKRNGTLIFPYLQPFGQRILDYHAEQRRLDPTYKGDSTFYFPELYTNIATNFQYVASKNNRITITVRYSGGTSSTINLNAFNIVDGSVRVSVAGRQLVEGVDYRVDVNGGTITLLRPDLATAGALTVDYDVHDIFTTSTKNLFGIRGEIPILDRGLIGLTLMNFSLHQPSIKVRQGEEPLSNWILGADAGYKFSMPWLTDAMNALPIFNLKDKSELTAKVDAAISLPNPNTQISPMPVDNGASIAYLDDFEGGKTEFPLMMSYGRWAHASQPQSIPAYLSEGLYANSNLAQYWNDPINRRKSRTWWYERYPRDVLVTEIEPNKSFIPPAPYAQVLDMVFDPNRIDGIYNPNPILSEIPENRWGGLMQWDQGLNVIATNTDAIQFWMKIDGETDPSVIPNGVIHFDMGNISEDIVPDGKLETEDINGNGRYDPSEDIGLDRMPDDSEKIFFSPSGGAHITPFNPNDPSNDNYNYDITAATQNYDNINGTEGNQNDGSYGLHPDTEDLNGNTTLDVDNNYYEYDIPLNPSNPYIIGQSGTGWYQYRIPITNFARGVGLTDSSFSNINYYRIWFSNFSKKVHLRFNDIGLIGSQWTRGIEGLNPINPAGDSSFRINYVNIEDNGNPPTSYIGPPGAIRDQIAGGTAIVLGNEQSIDMNLNCVQIHSSREATRIFPAPNDLFNYRSMAIWVHGDSKMPTTVTPDKNQVWVYFRFGTDQYNYYEYRRPLARDWQNIHVDFGLLAALKATKKNYADTVFEPVGDGVPGSTYRVVGLPTMTNAPYFVLGVDNEGSDACLTTDVWWDELRLLNANNTIDYAMNATVQAKLAEFGTITGSILNEGPDFHRVDERFNMSRTRNFAWNVTGEFLMQKVLPSWLEKGTVFPLTISHSETILTPKYEPNTDVNVNDAVAKIQGAVSTGQLSQALATEIADSIRLTNETLTVRNSFAATGVHFTFPGSFFLLPAFLNKLTYGFGYGEEFTRSPQYLYNRSWSWTASILYDLQQIPVVSISPLTWIAPETFDIGRYSGYKINFLPQKFSTGISATRGRIHYLNRVSTLEFPPNSTFADTLDVLNSNVPFINRIFTASRGFGFVWKLTENGLISPQIEYRLDVSSNLAGLETYIVNNQPGNYYDSAYVYQRSFKNIMSDVFFKDGALARLGKDYLEVQHFRLTTNPRLPWLFWLDKYIRPIFSYNVDYKWTDALTGQQNAKTGSWNNVITTGLEFNLRELGVGIFGNDAPAPSGGVRRGRGEAQSVRGEDNKPGGQIAGGQMPPDMPSPNMLPPGRPGVRRVGDATRNTPGGHTPPEVPVGRTAPAPVPIDTSIVHSPGVGTRGIIDDLSVNDTVLTPKAPTDLPPEEIVDQGGITARDVVKALIQKPFFDWNGTKFNFIETNYSLNGALQGDGPGITNFLARGIFSPEYDANGPSRAYQLGLINDPSGRLIIKFVPIFPFVQFGVRHGLRAPNPYPIAQTVDITDVFTQKNTFELTTSRPLWAGATISLNWKTEFTYDERDQLNIGNDGTINPLTTAKTGDVSRTFLSFPPLPFLNITQSGIQNVGQKWIASSNAELIKRGIIPSDGARDSLPADVKNKLQVQSFLQGFETLPFFTSAIREYLPRLNYSFNWSGLEKFPLFKFADRASFRTAYTGNYKRTFKLNPGDTLALTTLQTVTYAFRPLIAFDLGWDKIWGGKMNASINYDTQTDWASDYSFNRITKRLATTFGITANFQKEGLSIPFLKLNLKNTFGATFTLSQTIANDLYYQFNDILTNPAGTSNGGITKITFEQRFSYDLNQQLTIEAFYHYERTTPASSGVLVPPTRLITAGFDIRLKVF